MGGIANGTLQGLAAASRLPAYPADITAEDEHLKALTERYAKVATTVRDGIDQTSEADTADILIGYSCALDKALWFLEAHLPN